MASKKLFSLKIFLAIILAICGVLTPIIWDWYKSKISLELQHLSAVTVVETTKDLEKLQIFYDNKPITSISKMTFVLINNGRTPILKNDLVTPPTLKLSGNTKLLDFQIEKVIPENLEYSYNLDRKNRFISFNFPLLNPADLIQFSLIISGEIPDFEIEGRIVGLKKISVIERVKEVVKQPRRIPLAVYPVAFFTFFLTLVIYIMLNQTIKDIRIEKDLKSKVISIPHLATKREYIDFVNNTFSHKTPSERKAVNDLIFYLLTNQKPANDEKQFTIELRIKALLKDTSSTILGAIILSLICFAGYYYFLSNIF